MYVFFVCMYVHMCVCIFCMDGYMHACIHACMHVCVCVCMNECTLISTSLNVLHQYKWALDGRYTLYTSTNYFH